MTLNGIEGHICLTGIKTSEYGKDGQIAVENKRILTEGNLISFFANRSVKTVALYSLTFNAYGNVLDGIAILKEDWNTTSGETVDSVRRDIERLKAQA